MLRLHDFEGEDFMISSISPDDKGSNSDNVDDKDTSGTFAEEGLQWISARPLWIEETLLVVKEVSKLFCQVDIRLRRRQHLSRIPMKKLVDGSKRDFLITFVL